MGGREIRRDRSQRVGVKERSQNGVKKEILSDRRGVSYRMQAAPASHSHPGRETLLVTQV